MKRRLRASHALQGLRARPVAVYAVEGGQVDAGVVSLGPAEDEDGAIAQELARLGGTAAILHAGPSAALATLLRAATQAATVTVVLPVPAHSAGFALDDIIGPASAVVVAAGGAAARRAVAAVGPGRTLVCSEAAMHALHGSIQPHASVLAVARVLGTAPDRPLSRLAVLQLAVEHVARHCLDTSIPAPLVRRAALYLHANGSTTPVRTQAAAGAHVVVRARRGGAVVTCEDKLLVPVIVGEFAFLAAVLVLLYCSCRRISIAL